MFMLQLSSQGPNAFALYEKKTEARLARETFKNLLNFLRSLFINHFQEMVFGTQCAYIFHASENELRNAIALFLREQGLE